MAKNDKRINDLITHITVIEQALISTVAIVKDVADKVNKQHKQANERMSSLERTVGSLLASQHNHKG